ncbi:hypothetical protein [Streptomyces prasinus]|uniref:hypothetical protein n=1 Tax=Streptomyces prasinus TaxID=67345 RepID=UPI003D9E9FF7
MEVRLTVADGLGPVLPSSDAVPDVGNVRDDLPTLCPRVRDAMLSRPDPALCSVIHECDPVRADRFHPDPALCSVIHECDPVRADRFHAVIFEGVVEPFVRMLRVVIEP